MAVINEIVRTIHAIRRAHDCDVERLCFEVSAQEWEELVTFLSMNNLQTDFRPPYGRDASNVMGITVRKRPTETEVDHG